MKIIKCKNQNKKNAEKIVQEKNKNVLYNTFYNFDVLLFLDDNFLGFFENCEQCRTFWNNSEHSIVSNF